VVDSIAARRILDGVLRVLPSCNTEGHAVEVIDAWLEGENILCVTYRAPWFGPLRPHPRSRQETTRLATDSPERHHRRRDGGAAR
jgi:hypothetical protein